MRYEIFVYLLPLVFVAYFCKATTGFGSAIIMMAIGSIIVGPVPALILTAVLDVVGGLALLRLDTTRDTRRLWMPLSIAMVTGVTLGGVLLRLFALDHIQYAIALGLLSVGAWLIFVRSRYESSRLRSNLPEALQFKDLGVCLVGVVCGGLSGLSGAPVVFYFGKRLGKEGFRRILTRIFLAEALARLAVYLALGVLDAHWLVISLLAMPPMFLGLYVGNRAFFKTPETWYSRVTGAISIVAAVRILM